MRVWIVSLVFCGGGDGGLEMGRGGAEFWVRGRGVLSGRFGIRFGV